MLESVALIYKLNNGLVASSLDGLSDDEVWGQPAGSGNPIAWLVGHLTETRGKLLTSLGTAFDPGWPAVFSRGSMMQGRDAYPARTAIETAWRATHHPMRDVFAALSAEQLAAPTRSPFPGVKSLADHLAALAFHEAYHVGQMGYVRKLLGRSALVG